MMFLVGDVVRHIHNDSIYIVSEDRDVTLNLVKCDSVLSEVDYYFSPENLRLIANANEFKSNKERKDFAETIYILINGYDIPF